MHKFLLVAVGAFACVIDTACVFAQDKEYTFVAAPRGIRTEEKAIYEPLASYLTKATGTTIRVVYSDNWLSFRKALRDNTYDFVFGGPQFTSYSIAYNGHEPLVRFEESHTFLVIVSADERRFNSVADLAGRPSCLHPEPNFGTLLFMNEFANPARQPVAVTINGWKEAYEGVVKHRCVAAVLPRNNFEKLNKEGQVRIIHTFKGAPNQAITASNGVPREIVQKIKAALLADNGCQKECNTVLSANGSKRFVEAEAPLYAGIADVLRGDFLLGKKMQERTRLA